MSRKVEVEFALKILILALIDGEHASMDGVIGYQGREYRVIVKEVKNTAEIIADERKK